MTEYDLCTLLASLDWHENSPGAAFSETCREIGSNPRGGHDSSSVFLQKKDGKGGEKKRKTKKRKQTHLVKGPKSGRDQRSGEGHKLWGKPKGPSFQPLTLR